MSIQETVVRPGGLPKLGLVCITASDEVRYRALTRKRLLQFEPSVGQAMLRELYADNLQRFDQALDFCHRHGIELYRLTSGLFPFADDPVGTDLVDELADEMRRIGARASALGVRVVLHPDQYVVLSSDSPQVVENSVKILTMHARILDLLGQPRSSWALMNIHGGKGDRAERLASVIRDLPDQIRTRLVLENDEHAYSAEQILEVCRHAGVPMVFDAHHHVCRETITSYNHPSIPELLTAARETWPEPAWQLVHISNGRDYFTDPRHSDLVTQMPDSFYNAPWIEVEAKHKEIAIEKLRSEWLSDSQKRDIVVDLAAS